MQEKNQTHGTADKMKSVKAAWDKAPAGPKKDGRAEALPGRREGADGEERQRVAIAKLEAATHALA